MKRRFLSLLLAAIMLCSLLPMTAGAAESMGPDEDDVVEIFDTEENVTTYFSQSELVFE